MLVLSQNQAGVFMPVYLSCRSGFRSYGPAEVILLSYNVCLEQIRDRGVAEQRQIPVAKLAPLAMQRTRIVAGALRQA